MSQFTGNHSFPQPSHDSQSNSEAPKQGIFSTLSDRADQGETYVTRPPLKSSGSAGSASFFSDFASGSHNNQFGPGVRAKISTVLPTLIETIPISSYATIFLTEYGCMHSRAVHMFKGMIECFVARVRGKLEKDPSFHENQRLEARRASRTGYAEETADWVSCAHFSRCWTLTQSPTWIRCGNRHEILRCKMRFFPCQ